MNRSAIVIGNPVASKINQTNEQMLLTIAHPHIVGGATTKLARLTAHVSPQSAVAAAVFPGSGHYLYLEEYHACRLRHHFY